MSKFIIAYFLVVCSALSCAQSSEEMLHPTFNKKLNMLQIGLPNHWVDISSENPDGPSTYINELYDEPGVLQISFSEYLKGEKPKPNYYDLIELSKNVGEKQEFGTLQITSSGDCNFGKYGVVQFSSTKFPYISVWHISDGQNFIFATFICSKSPSKDDINDVKRILTSIKKAK